MQIIDLPIETLDEIASAIGSPADLENLGAVCSQLHSLVSPYHIQFRIIRAPLLSPVWQKLAEKPSLARNVRTLQVQFSQFYYSANSIIPAIFRDLEGPSLPEPDANDIDVDDEAAAIRAYNAAKNAMDLNAERIFVSALKGMSRLTSFQWSRTPPLINPNEEDDVWVALAKYCPLLTSVDVVDIEKPYELLEEVDDPAYQRPSKNPNFFLLLKNLKYFSFKTDAFHIDDASDPNIHAEQCEKRLIEHCPNLEVLKLQYVVLGNHPRFHGAAQWANLRELIIFGFKFISTEFASFLASHPTLETLSLLDIRLEGSLTLPPGVLPRLKWLRAYPERTIISSILQSTVFMPRPLEYINGALLDNVFLDNLELSGSGPTLKKLIGQRTVDLSHLVARLSYISPYLELLNVGVSGILTTQIDRSMYSLLGKLPALRTLRGVKVLSSNCEPPSENNEIIRALLQACPNLRRLDWYMGDILDLSSAVIIERHGSQVIWSLCRMDGDKEGPIDDSRGERGRGCFER